MTDPISVRPIMQADYDQWLPLWLGYNAFYGRSGPTALDPAITAMTWQRFFDGYEPVNCLVAELDGQVVGIVHFLYHRSTTAISPSCYLQDLFTDPSVRGRGIGRALIEAVYRRAAADGAGRVYWLTHKDNQTARRLYDTLAETAGFIVYRKGL